MPYVKPDAPKRFRIDSTKYATMTLDGKGMVYVHGDRKLDGAQIPFGWSFVDGLPVLTGELTTKTRDAILKSMFVTPKAKDRPDKPDRSKWRADADTARV